jgi:hypothetical protein
MKTPSPSTFASPLIRFLTVCLLSLAPVTLLIAQDATPTTLLPDIDPQDIEIRGDFQVRFPGITRQPILGFNPRPRVFQIDPNRMPFIETPEQVVASLPVSELDRPAPPPFVFYQKPERFRLWSTTGIGNYMSPEADVFLEIPIRQRTLVGGSFHNFSSGSYLGDDTDQTSSFRNMNGALQAVHYAGNRSRWEAGLTARSDRNHLPITEISQTAPLAPLVSSPDNNIGSFGMHAGYRNTRNAVSFTDVQIGYRAFNAETGEVAGLPLTAEAGPNTFSEQLISARLKNSWAGRMPGQILNVSGGVRYGNVELADTQQESWIVSDMGLSFQARVGHAFRAEVGIRGYYAQDAIKSGQLLLYPELGLQYDLNDRLTLRGNVEGFVENAGLEGHSEVNRRVFAYTMPENERGVRLRAAAEYEIMQGFRVQSGIGYTRFTRHAAYALQPGSRNLLTYAYSDGANVLKWDISTWYDLIPDQLNAYGGIYIQSSTDRNGDRIAFRENVGVSAGGIYRFNERLRVHLWADYTGSRKVEPGRSENGFLLLGTKVDVWASRDIGAYIKITNMLNQSYSQWTGYNELPAQVFGGIMIKL